MTGPTSPKPSSSPPPSALSSAVAHEVAILLVALLGLIVTLVVALLLDDQHITSTPKTLLFIGILTFAFYLAGSLFLKSARLFVTVLYGLERFFARLRYLLERYALTPRKESGDDAAS